MGYLRAIIFVMAVGFCFIFVSDAKAGPKIAVELNHSGTDTVGQRLAYAIKEVIRRSNAMRLTITNEPRYIISIITLDNSMYKGYSTAYSIAWIYCLTGDKAKITYFITHSVGICGSNRVGEVAEELVAQTDKIITGD